MTARADSFHVPTEMVAAVVTRTGEISPEELSLERVFVENVDFVWRVLRACGVRDADLDDVTQDVFVIVQRRLASFEGRSKITTWLFAIAERVAKDYRRSARHRYEEISERPHESMPFVDGESECEDAILRGLLDDLLDELPQPQRVVFVLFEIDGYTAEEIAALVGAPMNTVYSRLRLARARFEKSAERLRARGVR